jgi:hypothetical protein
MIDAKESKKFAPFVELRQAFDLFLPWCRDNALALCLFAGSADYFYRVLASPFRRNLRGFRACASIAWAPGLGRLTKRMHAYYAQVRGE